MGLCLINLMQVLNCNNVPDLKFVMYVFSVFGGRSILKDYKSLCSVLTQEETTIEILS